MEQLNEKAIREEAEKACIAERGRVVEIWVEGYIAALTAQPKQQGATVAENATEVKQWQVFINQKEYNLPERYYTGRDIKFLSQSPLSHGVWLKDEKGDMELMDNETIDLKQPYRQQYFTGSKQTTEGATDPKQQGEEEILRAQLEVAERYMMKDVLYSEDYQNTKRNIESTVVQPQEAVCDAKDGNCPRPEWQCCQYNKQKEEADKQWDEFISDTASKEEAVTDEQLQKEAEAALKHAIYVENTIPNFMDAYLAAARKYTGQQPQK